MRLYEFDKVTGRITCCRDYPTTNPETIMTILSIYPDSVYCAIGHEGDDLTHYVLDGEVVPRPVQNIVRDGMTLKGVRKTATIKIGEKTYTCDGSNIELSFPRPGIYNVTVIEWPYTDWSDQIEVSA